MDNPEDLQRAKAAGIKCLSYRNRSRHEVREYLSKKGFSPAVVQETILYLQKLNYLNDKIFAQSWGRSRIQAKKLGKKRLRQELLSKGVEPALVGDTLDSLYSDVDESQLAVEIVKKKLAGLKEMDVNRKRSRIAQLLARKGFNSETIYKILDQFFPFE
jgi:regulatory protein